MTFHAELIELLKTDKRLSDDSGELILAAVHDLAWKFDHSLVALLLSNKNAKDYFFTEIVGHWVFNINMFTEFTSEKNFLDNSYTRFKNRVGLTIGNKFLKERGEVSLVWPYKDSVLEGGQTRQEERRKEIFFNEVLAYDEINRLLDPKVLTNFTRYSEKGASTVETLRRDETNLIKDNLIIRGNNLIALHTIKSQFRGRVNLVYIDPPFNTGTDEFGYNDNFNHSSWLTFMKNRLEIAKELLAEDGSIYVHLDSNEAHYCKVLMDEIFGQENFQREVIWRMGWVSGYKTIAKNWIRNHDTLLFYTKNPKAFTFNKQYLPYPEGYERWGGREKGDGLVIEDIWGIHVGEKINSLAVIGFSKEYTGFRTQKPEGLLRRIIEVSSNKDDIILDFCLATGTTASVAHKLGRQYIGIEQMEYGESDSVPRMQRVINGDDAGISNDIGWKGGGEFVYCELMKYNQNYIDQIEDAKTTNELLDIWKKISSASFLNWYVNSENPEEAVQDFIEVGTQDKGLEKQKRLLLQLLDKNQLYVNLSEIDDIEFEISKDIKELNKAFYGEYFNA